MRGRKGVAFVWLTALVIIFTIGLIYTTMTEPYETVWNYTHDRINDTAYEATFTQLRTLWRYWPILTTVGIMLWAVLSSMRRDPNEYYQ
ncbi:MAG TPA: hypothetical protein VJB16_04005 [archaeon]|nr:hypothetical protein [archaeon]